MKPLYQIIRKPLITEKATAQKGAGQVVTFEVGRDANKLEIKQAVEKAFSVKVTDVRTMQCGGKKKRLGTNFGKRANWKKAYVSLAEGDSIDFYGV